jgi:hypothetical protein
MQDADRIPIDLGYEVAAEADMPPDQRTTVREDGTLVIDILAPQPCAPDPSTGDEIVVCAPAQEGTPPVEAPPPDPSITEKVGEALHVRIGPFELGSIGKRDGTRFFGARLRF